MRTAQTLLSAAIGFLLPCAALFAEPPTDMQLFLLIGQSNMAGRGKVTPADVQTHPRIFMLDKANAWVPAKDPAHFDKPTIAGVGLCSEFARRAAADAPQAKIGLIPCAVGGTTKRGARCRSPRRTLELRARRRPCPSRTRTRRRRGNSCAPR